MLRIASGGKTHITLPNVQQAAAANIPHPVVEVHMNSQFDLIILNGHFIQELKNHFPDEEAAALHKLGEYLEKSKMSPRTKRAAWWRRLFTRKRRPARVGFVSPENGDYAGLLRSEGFEVQFTSEEFSSTILQCLQGKKNGRRKSILLPLGILDIRRLLEVLNSCDVTVLAFIPKPGYIKKDCRWINITEILYEPAPPEPEPEPEPIVPADEAVALLTLETTLLPPTLETRKSLVRTVPELIPSKERLRKQFMTFRDEFQNRISECELQAEALESGDRLAKCSSLQIINTFRDVEDCWLVLKCYELLLRGSDWFSRMFAMKKLPKIYKQDFHIGATVLSAGCCILRTYWKQRTGLEMNEDAVINELFTLLRGGLDGYINQFVSFMGPEDWMHFSRYTEYSKKLHNLELRNFGNPLQVELRRRENCLHFKLLELTRLLNGRCEEERILITDDLDEMNLNGNEEEKIRYNAVFEMWTEITREVTQLCEQGEKTNALFFRDEFKNLTELVPTDLEMTEEFIEVMQNVEIYLNRWDEKLEQEALEAELAKERWEEDPNIREVRRLYGGKRMLVVGGIPIAHMKNRLERAFQVEIGWQAVTHTQSIDRLAAYVKDPRYACILVLIKWASHKHSEELGEIAVNHGKRFVRLRRETNPFSIAVRILEE